MLGLCEGLCTDPADEGLLTSVDDIMSLEFIRRGEGLWTNRAMMHLQHDLGLVSSSTADPLMRPGAKHMTLNKHGARDNRKHPNAKDVHNILLQQQ